MAYAASAPSPRALDSAKAAVISPQGEWLSNTSVPSPSLLGEGLVTNCRWSLVPRSRHPHWSCSRSWWGGAWGNGAGVAVVIAAVAAVLVHTGQARAVLGGGLERRRIRIQRLRTAPRAVRVRG